MTNQGKSFERNKLLGCFVSEQEKEFIKETAEALGFSAMSELLRTALFAYLTKLQTEADNTISINAIPKQVR